MTLLYLSLNKFVKISLITISVTFLLLLSSATSSVYNVNAQQSSANGGSASGGNIKLGGSGIGSYTCYAYVANGCSAAGASANGGAANGGATASDTKQLAGSSDGASTTDIVPSPVGGSASNFASGESTTNGPSQLQYTFTPNTGSSNDSISGPTDQDRQIKQKLQDSQQAWKQFNQIQSAISNINKNKNDTVKSVYNNMKV